MISHTCTLTTPPTLPVPGSVSTARPSGQCDRFTCLLHSKTRSTFFKFTLSDDHFFCSVNIGRYSRVHRHQNMLVATWTAFHLRRVVSSTSLLLINGVLLDRRPNRK